jgi:predicted  nucleic acid-binding Zn-ribbon protein
MPNEFEQQASGLREQLTAMRGQLSEAEVAEASADSHTAKQADDAARHLQTDIEIAEANARDLEDQAEQLRRDQEAQATTLYAEADEIRHNAGDDPEAQAEAMRQATDIESKAKDLEREAA